MRRSTIITLVSSVAFGGLAIVLARGFINNSLEAQFKQSKPNVIIAKQTKKIETVSILVAEGPIARGSIVTSQDVRFAEFPIDAAPSGSFKKYDQLFSKVVDMQVIALNRMAGGEAILDFKVSKPGGRLTLSEQISPNMRAVSIHTDAISGVAGFIQPGDKVDVTFTRSIDDIQDGDPRLRRHFRKEEPDVVAIVIAQNILVLGIDQRIDTHENKVSVARTITLEVTQHQAQMIAVGKEAGTLSLSLRPAGAHKLTDSKKLNIADLKPANIKKKTARKHYKKTTQKQETAKITIVRNGQPAEVSVFKETKTELQMAGGSL